MFLAAICGTIISTILAWKVVDGLPAHSHRGRVLWHMLTGDRPFHALSEEEISDKLEEKGHPVWVAGLIHSSAQRRDRRIQTVAEFRIMLENEGRLA